MRREKSQIRNIHIVIQSYNDEHEGCEIENKEIRNMTGTLQDSLCHIYVSLKLSNYFAT